MNNIWIKVSLLLVVVAAISILGFVTFFYLWLNSYLASDDFKQTVGKIVASELDAEGEFEDFHWSGSSVHCPGFTATGSSTSLIDRVKVSDIRADLNFRAIFSGKWELTRIHIQNVKISSKDPLEGVKENIDPGLQVDEKPSGWLTWLLPSDIAVKEVIVENAEFSWSHQGKEAGKVQGVYLTAFLDGKTWAAEGKNGKFVMDLLPEMQLSGFKVRYRKPELFITHAELRPRSYGGQVNTSGVMNFEGDQEIELTTELVRLEVEPFLPKDWRASLKGYANGNLSIDGSTKYIEKLTVKGKVRLEDGVVQALPPLEKLAEVTRMEQFQNLKLTKASTKVDYQQEDLYLKDIYIQSDDFLKVTGQVTMMKSNELDGTLEVGTAPRVLRYIPGAEAEVFTRKEEGVLWASPAVKISGTLDQPSEDLTARLMNAAQGQVIKAVQEGVKVLEEEVKDKAKQLYDFISPFFTTPAPEETIPEDETLENSQKNP